VNASWIASRNTLIQLMLNATLTLIFLVCYQQACYCCTNRYSHSQQQPEQQQHPAANKMFAQAARVRTRAFCMCVLVALGVCVCMCVCVCKMKRVLLSNGFPTVFQRSPNGQRLATQSSVPCSSVLCWNCWWLHTAHTTATYINIYRYKTIMQRSVLSS
jgi:hypothetical protein